MEGKGGVCYIKVENSLFKFNISSKSYKFRETNNLHCRIQKVAMEMVGTLVNLPEC